MFREDGEYLGEPPDLNGIMQNLATESLAAGIYHLDLTYAAAMQLDKASARASSTDIRQTQRFVGGMQGTVDAVDLEIERARRGGIPPTREN